MKTVYYYVSIFWLVTSTVFPKFCVAGLQDTDSLRFNIRTIDNFDSMGTYYSIHSDNQEALIYFNKALVLKKQMHDSSGLISSYEHISYSLQLLKKYREAISFRLMSISIRNKIMHTLPNKYFLRVSQLMAKPEDSLNLTRLYYRYALLLSNDGRKRQGIDYYIQALKLAQALKYEKAISTIANDLAGEYWDLGEKKLSTFWYEKALVSAIRINDSNRMAAIYLNLGDNYKEQGHLETSMNLLIKALKIKESINDSSHLSFYFIKAAEIAKVSRNWKKWEEYIRRAYEVKDFDHCASQKEKAIIYENLGSIAEQNDQLNKAFQYYDTLMDISRKINYINGIRVALNSRAQLYKKMGQPAKALRLISAADKYITENPFYHINSNNSKAELYLETGEYKKTLPLLRENIASLVLENYADAKLRTLQLLYKVNTRMANYKEAFRWNDSLRNFENFLRDKDVRAKIAEMETKYETEKHKHLISLLKAKNEIYDQQIGFAILLIIGLIVVIILGIFMARMNKLKAEYRENKIQQQLLRSQMNPHFIFNALSSIQLMIQNQEMKKADFYLGKFASIARLVLEYSREESIPLDKEIEILQSYIELEKLRSDNRFEYKINFANDLETEFIRIPPMALQSFVENAIKHGLKEKKENGLLQLWFKDQGEILEVVIEDNGIGIEHAHQTRKLHKSMAMEIFEERRRLLQKRYRRKLFIQFTDLNSKEKSGTRVIIHLPIL